MKLRTDIVLLYKELHSWAGILCGLFLFTAFYAGAITMFEAPLERYLSPRIALPAAPALADTNRLMQTVFKAHPEAKKEFSIHVDPDKTARMTWVVRQKGERRDHNHDSGKRFGASFDATGALVVAEIKPSVTAQFIDTLHQQAGIPLEHETAMLIVGAICLLYALALVSGTIVLLPSLVKDLFALRLHKNFKRKWLDVHNVLGLFSLPFHIVIALTSLVFAFHDVFYDSQNAVLYGGKMQTRWERPVLADPAPGTKLMAPDALITAVKAQAPGFEPVRLDYRSQKPGKVMLQVWGHDDRYALRAPSEGLASTDPYTGKILNRDYLPGHQNGWLSTVTAFFALHFGNFGGLSIRWSYVLLGLSGAFLFYTGNLLWIEGRTRRNGGMASKTTKALANTTIGWTLGTIAGISTTVAAAKLAGAGFGETQAWSVFAVVLIASIGWAFWRGAEPAKRALAWAAGGTTLIAGLLLALV